METRAIYSAGGFAREIAGHLSECMDALDQPFKLMFIDDNPELWGTQVHGHDVIGYQDARAIEGIKINVAFAEPALRRAKVARLDADGIGTFSIQALNFFIGRNVTLGRGGIYCHNSMVTADAKLGDYVHLNIYSYVAHDCIVGDFVTFAPRVSLNGRIRVEDDVYIGSDATFLPGNSRRFLTIGKGAIIGAGAVVTKDVEPGTTVVGAPAKQLARKV